MSYLPIDWLIGFYLLVNIITFLLVARDKYLARNHRWRIPEKWFFTLGLLGGALGCWLGMQVFRHKTKHKSFTIGIPLLMILNLGLAYLFLIAK